MRHKGSCQWIICPTSAFKCFTFHRRKTVDGSIIHSLESAVIEWSHQIRAVLKKDSSEALLEGKSPTPHTELLFWNNRSGPVLLQTLHVHWRPLSSTCSVSWLYENKNTSSEDLQSWIVVFKVFAVANYSSFRRNTCAIKRKMWFGAHCFLFVLFFLSATAESHLLRPVSTTFIICFFCSHVTKACLFSICFALWTHADLKCIHCYCPW